MDAFNTFISLDIFNGNFVCMKKTVCDIFMRVHVRACCYIYLSVSMDILCSSVSVCVCACVSIQMEKLCCRFYLDVVRRLERRVLAVVAAAAAVSLSFRFFLQ